MSFEHRGRSLNKVAVIGSGQIGPDIALYFTKVLSPFGVKTVVVDVAEEALQKGRAKLEKKIAKGVETGAFKEAQQKQMLEAVEFTSDYEKVRGTDFVLEAATEDSALKRRIFAQVEELVDSDAILASNSSHLEPEAIFEEAKHPERSTVIHYFFPAERNLIVEVVPGKATSPAVSDWLMSFYEQIGKVPLAVNSRYGYALDPIFEGLFQACALIAESGLATSKQIDSVAQSALGMTVGSFTAMNLTGGNPITCVGLDNYTSKINSWFATPQSLKDRVASGEAWEVPARGEDVEVPADLKEKLTRMLRGAYFGLCGEIIDAGLISVGDFNLGLQMALDMKPAFSFMNKLGLKESLALVEEYAAGQPNFVVPECIKTRAANGENFVIPNILRTDHSDVAVLTIRRPRVLNALDQSVFDELEDQFAAVEADPKIQAAVLTGFGKKAFVSGADVGFLAKIENQEQGEATAAGSQRVLNAIEDMSKPVICAMNGLAFGGGNELAMACTQRIAKKGLKVLAAQPEPNLGIIPGAGGSQRLPRLIGLEPAAELLRRGRPISSARALELGLISEEVDGDLVAKAIEIARAIAGGVIERPSILREPMSDLPESLPALDIGHLSKKVDDIMCKAILEGAAMDLRSGIAFEAKCFGEVCATEDMRIGVQNFIKNGPRSKAEFKHR
ncbi:MAG: 3-hydroxyacyl-CoA dehydrogenase/enoyl-CoA hydratase family protein [Planctomycetota bacterium]|jgi:enoyl-CoA hydratase/carnithine racemase/3-hydroxyacyl-CoA dehydrogenase